MDKDIKAKEKLESALKKSKIYYLDESKSMLLNNNAVHRHMDLNTYKLFCWDKSIGAMPMPTQLILNAQKSRSRDYKPESNSHGYLKMNLKNFALTVSRWGGSATIVAFYIEDEDKLFFKTGNMIHAYIEAMVKDKNKNKTVVPAYTLVQNRVKYIKLFPSNPEKYSPDFEVNNTTGKQFISSFLTRSIKTNFPLAFEENEFIELISKFNNYPDIFKLKYKTLKRIMER